MNMKNYLNLIVAAAAVVCSTQAFSQAPAGFNYQAALRTTAGAPMVSQAVTIRFGIYSGIMMNLKVYEETHALTTSAQGMVNCVVGKGSVVLGNLKTISWGSDIYNMKVEVNSGTGFVDMGTQQLISVPYAQHANTAGSSRTTDTAKFAKAAYTSQLADTAIVAISLYPGATIAPSQILTTGGVAGDVLQHNGTYWQPATLPAPFTAGNGVDLTGGVIYTPWSMTGSMAGSSTYYNNGGYVGIGTSSPLTNLDVIGTIKTDAIMMATNAGAGKVLTSDGSGYATWQNNGGTLATMNSVSNSGNLPLTTGVTQFVAAPAPVTITSSSQKVFITSSKLLGSTVAGGATGLNLYISYNTTGAANPVTNLGAGSFGYQCLQNERNSYTLSYTVTGLAPGTYYFGLAASTTNANWNSQEFSYTSVMVFN